VIITVIPPASLAGTALFPERPMAFDIFALPSRAKYPITDRNPRSREMALHCAVSFRIEMKSNNGQIESSPAATRSLPGRRPIGPKRRRMSDLSHCREPHPVGSCADPRRLAVLQGGNDVELR
jgi:hypothetical protein